MILAAPSRDDDPRPLVADRAKGLLKPTRVKRSEVSVIAHRRIDEPFGDSRKSVAQRRKESP